MSNDSVRIPQAGALGTANGPILPAVIAHAGEKAGRCFIEFLTATIRNSNTRQAYARAIGDFFAWCERHRLALLDIEPVHVAAYIEALTKARSAPTDKQHLAAIRRCFDWLTSSGVLDFNPASSVRDPKHVVKQGKTPVLTADEAKQLLASIIPEKKENGTDNGEDAAKEEEQSKPPTIAQLRDRALIAGHGVQLRPRLRRLGDDGRGLLHRGAARLVPPARERRQAPRGARPPQRRGVRGRLSRSGRHRRRQENPPLPQHRPPPQPDPPPDAPQRRLAHD